MSLKQQFLITNGAAIKGLAYGELAGVSAVQGLYVSTFPPLIYALLGTTRHISIGKWVNK